MQVRHLLLSMVLAINLPALGDSSAQARLHGLQTQLHDLTPDDGLSPTLNWAMTPADLRSTSGQENLQIGWQSLGSDLLVPLWGPGDVVSHDAMPPVLASSATSTHGWASGQADATGMSARSTATAGIGTFGVAYSFSYFAVSPHTQATFSIQLDYQLSASDFVWQDQPISGTSYSQDAKAEARAWMFVRNDEGGPLYKASFQKSLAVPLGASHAELSGSAPLALTFSNESDMWVTYSFQWQTVVSASQTVALPVPEPASLVMLLAGLAAVGVTTRRRQAALG